MQIVLKKAEIITNCSRFGARWKKEIEVGKTDSKHTFSSPLHVNVDEYLVVQIRRWQQLLIFSRSAVIVLVAFSFEKYVNLFQQAFIKDSKFLLGQLCFCFRSFIAWMNVKCSKNLHHLELIKTCWSLTSYCWNLFVVSFRIGTFPFQKFNKSAITKYVNHWKYVTQDFTEGFVK